MRVVCLISGSGSNLQALLDWQHRGDLGAAEVVGVISNEPGARGLARAEQAGLQTACVPHGAFSSREAFDAALADHIDAHQPDLIALAGFMRILSAAFVQRYAKRLINIHPSLLPKYKGLDTHRRAIEAGDAVAGASVHWVTEALDAGAIIRQATVPIEPSDSPEDLKARVLIAEHQLYPSVIRDLSLGVITP